MGGGISGIVFDCDGLLLDTESRWTIAERGVVESLGGVWSADLKERLLGTSLARTSRILADHMGLEPDAEPGIGEAIMDRYEVVLETHSIDPLAGVEALLSELGRRRVPLAVASNTPARFTRHALRASGLPVDVFSTVVCAGDDGLAPKPAPDVYLAACRALRLDPGECVAFEDSPTGAAAARSAGMRVVGVPSLAGQTFEADVVLGSLDGLGVDALLDGRLAELA
jgi:HAD superfamily hydrolase (TIGR01509 family)